MAVKLVPGGHPHHALAEAAANAARDGGFTADEIETITLSRPGLTALAGPLHPADLIDMAHSPAYFLAAGAADRDFPGCTPRAAKIGDPVIHRLIDKVHVGPPPTDNVERYRQGATVTIRATDGRTSISTVYVPKGAGMLGIAWADIDTKYRALVPYAGVVGRAGRIEPRADPRFSPSRPGRRLCRKCCGSARVDVHRTNRVDVHGANALTLAPTPGDPGQFEKP